ncbi:MAG TPA: tetratricopeptide repeat protein [bacterium]|nr:tetratricopeptide repeat protein [bacterium]
MYSRVVASLAVLLVAFVALNPGVAAAERASSGKPADFPAYLKDSNLPAIYLVELKRQCLEEGNVAGCRTAAAILDQASRFQEAIGLADSLENLRSNPDPAAGLIIARSLRASGHPDRAIGVLDTLVASFPATGALAEAAGLRAACQLDLGLAGPALINLRAIEGRVGPSLRPEYVEWRARAEEDAGDVAKATELYQEAWGRGSVVAAVGLLRCALRDGRPEACPALIKDVSKRGLVLPHAEGCELAAMLDDVSPEVWRALLKSLVSDTTFDASAFPAAVSSIVRRAEAGDDVTDLAEPLLSRTASASVKQNLRYARALSLKNPVRSLDSLAYLVGEVSDPRLRIRCLGAALALDPKRRGALVSDLGGGVRTMYGELSCDERLTFSRTLIDCGAKEPAVADLKALLGELKAGSDDRAMTEIATLLEEAGERDKALAMYDQVAASPLQSDASLTCEKRAFLLRMPAGPAVDISKEVDKIAKKGASDLELGDLFMDKLKDYDHAATYYRTAASSAQGANADHINLKLAQALALSNVMVPDEMKRGEALRLLAALAESRNVKADDVLATTKIVTDWLAFDKQRVFEIASSLAQRKDVAPSTLYSLALVLFHLFEQDDLEVYSQCFTILTKLTTDGSFAKQAPLAGLLLGRLKYLAGDYAGARDALAAYAGKLHDPFVASVANRAIGECYLATGGAREALGYLSQGQAAETSFEAGCCYEMLGQTDSSEARYGAALGSPAPAEVADRARVRLGLALAAKGDFGKALAAVSSPLPEVRNRLASARLLVGACAMCARGYTKLGVQTLTGIGAGGSPVAAQALVSGAQYLSPSDPAAAYQMVVTAKPDSEYGFEDYAVLASRARWACSASEPEACTEARQEVLNRYPLDEDLVTELRIRRVMAMLENAPDTSRAADSLAQDLVASGAKHLLMADIIYRRGVQLLMKADYPGAEKTFSRLVTDYPTSPIFSDACFKLGSAYYMMKQYDSSATYFGRAVEVGKASLARDALFNWSLALEQTGHFREAATACYQLAVEFPFSEQFERALVRTGYCLQSAGLPGEAIMIYNAVLKYAASAETMAETRYWIAESYAQQGDHLRAACEFLRTAYLYPKEGQWAGTASFTAGDECEKAGLVDHAITIYRQNVRKYGKTSQWGKASDDRLAELVKPAPPPAAHQVPGGK